MDNFQSYRDAVSAPARNLFPVAPDNGADLPSVPKALYIGTGGNLSLRSVDGSAPVLLMNVPAGTILPVRAVRVFSTGTTAADIVAFA